jgi:dTDP-4-dehydrorhamnose 3,5-epimerase-like enzyme
MKLAIRPLALPEIKLISVPRFRDERGYLADIYVHATSGSGTV